MRGVAYHRIASIDMAPRNFAVPAPMTDTMRLTPTSVLSSVFHDLLDLMAPVTCVACGAAWPTVPAHTAPRGALCGSCATTLEPAAEAIDGVSAPWSYGGALAAAIGRAKYGGSPHVARQLGELLADVVQVRAFVVDQIVPVPLHRSRLAERGFNQAFELSRAMGRPIASMAIRRVRPTPPQVGMGRDERIRNVRDAFELTDPDALKGANVLIVDDVVTTGATLGEVARAVTRAGCASVHCAALARAVIGMPRV